MNIIAILFLIISTTEEEYPIVYELGGITVTAKRLELIPNLILEIETSEINKGGTISVGEALRFTPSVYTGKGRKGEIYLDIFGIEQREISIMIDGHPIRSPYNGNIDLEQIPVNNISKIEISLPPVSLLSGTDNLGGAVNIVTKKIARTVSVGYGQSNNIQSSINFGSTTGNFFYSLSGAYNKSDGYLLPDGSLRDNSDYNKRSINGKLGWNPDGSTEIGLSVSSFWDEKGLPLGLDRPRYWRFTYWNWWYAALHGKKEFACDIKLKGSLYYDKHKNTLTSYEDSTFTVEEWDSYYDNHSSGGYLILNLNPTDNTYTSFGGSYRYDNAELSGSDEPLEVYTGNTYSISMQEKVVIPNFKLQIEGEIGYDLFRKTDTKIDCANYRIGLVYLIDSENTFFISTGRINRFPTLRELYSSTSGNPELLPEFSNSYQMGINMKYLRFVLYRNDIDNLIEREDRYSLFENIKWSRFQGFSIIGKYKFLRAGYTFLDAYDDSYKELDGRARNKIDVGFRYEFNFGMSIDINGTWTSSRKNDTDTLNAYTLINLNLTQKVGNLFMIGFNVENIANEYYEDEKGYPLPGRNYGGNLSINF